MDAVGSDNAKIADKIVYKSVHSIISWSRLGIPST